MKRTKLFRMLALILVLALLLTGCTTGGGEVSSGTTTAGTTAATTVATTRFSPSNVEEDASLSIYIYTGASSQDRYLSEVYDFYASYKNLFKISLTEFEELEEMESRLQLELAAGQGPDVIIAHLGFGLDMMSLAKNGAFYDMTDVIAADESFNDEKYFLSVMEAGQINDRQYVIPLSFTLPLLVSNKTFLNEIGLDFETDTTITIYEKLLAHLKSSDTPQVAAFSGYADTIVSLMLCCGKTPFSEETGEVNLDGEEERMIMELGAELYKHRRQWGAEVPSTPFPSLETVKVPIMFDSYLTSPYHAQHYYSGYAHYDMADEMEMHFLTDTEGNHHALVQQFAAVSGNADHPELAWKLIRQLMDLSDDTTIYTGLSMNRGITTGQIRRSMGYRYPDSRYTMESLPQEYGDMFFAACDTIGGASIYQESPRTQIFTDAIKDYMNERVTFDTMVEDIKNKLKLYINE